MKIPKNYSLQVQCYTHETPNMSSEIDEDGDVIHRHGMDDSPDFVILKKLNSNTANIWALFSVKDGEIDTAISKSDSPVKLYKKVWGENV